MEVETDAMVAVVAEVVGVGVGCGNSQLVETEGIVDGYSDGTLAKDSSLLGGVHVKDVNTLGIRVY